MTTPEWRVPEPLDTVEIEAAGGARIILRRHGDVNGPRLVLSHDNGLAIDLYYPFWSRLASRFELIVYDLRNHGRNPTADLADHSVATFTADDARIRAGIEEHFGAKPAVGVFHSLSAMIALNQDPPGRGYAGLVLFDPPMYLPDGDHYGIDTLWRRLGMLARHRQPRFACPVKVIGGDPGVEFSSLPSVDLEGLIGWDYDFIPHTTHFLQLEHPEECVSTMVAFLEQAGLA
jgi:pimeloyl-ACP methyl ester carboxylesterase